MPSRSNWLIVLSESSISFLILLETSTMIVELFISPLKSVSSCFMYLGTLLFDAFTFIMLYISDVFTLLSL